MTKEPNKSFGRKLLRKQRVELAALAALPDDEIDTREMPEQKNWRGAVRGALYRPVKKQLTPRRQSR